MRAGRLTAALAGAILAAVMALAGAASARADVTSAGGLRLVSIGSFAQPTYVTSPPGDASRILVVEQSGTIRIVRDGKLLPQPFLTVADVHDAGEQGLLSIAFAPDYATSGRFYTYSNDAKSCDKTNSNCDVRIDEYRSAGAGADAADPASRRPVLRIDHKQQQNHNGGQLQFGPDGLLYVGVGDGGGAGDPYLNGQNRDTLLGKLLRIDPRRAGAAAYTSPLSNPFVGLPGADEIWAYGLRNPWRFSFDHLTGDLVIGDVGQDKHEEIDFQPAGFGGGANYGWSLYEGNERYSDPSGPQPSDYVPPVFSYDHSGGKNCAITGGYVVRDSALPALAGRYLYADYCAGVLRSLVLGPGRAADDAPVGGPAAPLSVGNPTSFGEDAACRLYVASIAGPVYRLQSATPAAAGGCSTVAGPGAGTGPGAGAGAAPGADRRRPVVARLRMVRAAFAVGRRPTAVIARARRLAPLGSAFRLTLSEDSTVTLRIARRAVGRRVGKRCVAPTRRLRHRRGCTRNLPAGALTRTLAAGRRTVAFSGRIGRRVLRPGRYTTTVTATDAAGNVSRPRIVTFTILAQA